MKREEILRAIRDRAVELGNPPKSNDPILSPRLVREAQRKIGSWRLCLWLSGVLREERQKKPPPSKAG